MGLKLLDGAMLVWARSANRPSCAVTRAATFTGYCCASVSIAPCSVLNECGPALSCANMPSGAHATSGYCARLVLSMGDICFPHCNVCLLPFLAPRHPDRSLPSPFPSQRWVRHDVVTASASDDAATTNVDVQHATFDDSDVAPSFAADAIPPDAESVTSADQQAHKWVGRCKTNSHYSRRSSGNFFYHDERD
jgi:hypothetical protein